MLFLTLNEAYLEIAGIVVVLILLFIAVGLRRVPYMGSWVIERRKQHRRTINTGVHYLIPFVDRVIAKIDLSDQMGEYFIKHIHTKDQIVLDCRLDITFQIFDVSLFTNQTIDLYHILSESLEFVSDDYTYQDIKTNQDLFMNQMFLYTDKVLTSLGMKLKKINIII